MKIINGFKVESGAATGAFKKHNSTAKYTNGEMVSCSMRKVQKDLYKLKDERFCIVGMPTGSGKSLAINFVFADYLTNNPQARLLISVPQVMIEKSFKARGVELNYNKRKKVNWSIGTNLCSGKEEDKINELIAFLKKRRYPKGLANRICICTHQTLSLAYQEIEKEGVKKYPKNIFKNTAVVIDEAHHILNSEHPLNDLSVEINQLGVFVSSFISQFKKNKMSRLWLTTATPFRGDKKSILSKKHLDNFYYHYLPFDKHWKDNIENIESYQYSFVLFKDQPFKEIRSVFKKNKKKTIIYCPKSNSTLTNQCAQGDKVKFSEKIIREIKKEWPKANILNLVDETNRKEKKKLVLNNKKSKKIDIILSIDMLNEGVDWDVAEQAIELTQTKSLVRRVQRFGRLSRDIKGKKHIYYYYFIPQCVYDPQNADSFKKSLNKNIAALVGSLIIENMINPVCFKSKNSCKNTNLNSNTNLIFDEVSDENSVVSIYKDISLSLIESKHKADNFGKDFTSKDAEVCITSVLRKHGVINNIDKITKQIVATFRRRFVPEEKSISWVVDEGFDLIWDENILDGIVSFVSQSCEGKSFEKFRKIYFSSRPIYSLEELCEKYKGLRKRNKKAANSKWLRESKYMWIHDQAYVHYGLTWSNFKKKAGFDDGDARKRRGYSIEELASIYRVIRKKNEGAKSMSWLRKNGFAWIERRSRRVFNLSWHEFKLKAGFDDTPDTPDNSLSKLCNEYREIRETYGDDAKKLKWLKENELSCTISKFKIHNLSWHEFKLKAGFDDTPDNSLSKLCNEYREIREAYGDDAKTTTWMKKNGKNKIVHYSYSKHNLTWSNFKKKAGFDDGDIQREPRTLSSGKTSLRKNKKIKLKEEKVSKISLIDLYEKYNKINEKNEKAKLIGWMKQNGFKDICREVKKHNLSWREFRIRAYRYKLKVS